jgi:hypothetical protein
LKDSDGIPQLGVTDSMRFWTPPLGQALSCINQEIGVLKVMKELLREPKCILVNVTSSGTFLETISLVHQL